MWAVVKLSLGKMLMRRPFWVLCRFWPQNWSRSRAKRWYRRTLSSLTCSVSVSCFSTSSLSRNSSPSKDSKYNKTLTKKSFTNGSSRPRNWSITSTLFVKCSKCPLSLISFADRFFRRLSRLWPRKGRKSYLRASRKSKIWKRRKRKKATTKFSSHQSATRARPATSSIFSRAAKSKNLPLKRPATALPSELQQTLTCSRPEASPVVATTLQLL